MIGTAPAVPASDGEVIAASRRDPSRFFELFDRHFQSVYRFLLARGRGDSAADLAAETFVVAFRRRSSFEHGRADARPWLFGIALNLARNEARSERRRLRALPRLVERPHEAEADIVERLDRRALPLDKALASLTVEERDVLLLFAGAELTYEEIATAVGVAVGTVRSRLHRARLKVREQLQEHQKGMDDDAR